MNEYQSAAHSTSMNVMPDDSVGYLDKQLMYPALGLAGEAGEVANSVKKMVRKPPIDTVAFDKAIKDLMYELGDTLWYIAEIATVLGVSLEDVAELNRIKLKNRAKMGQIAERFKTLGL